MNSNRLEKLEHHLYQRVSWSDLDQDYLKTLIGLAKAEDMSGLGLLANPYPEGDVTSALVGKAQIASASLVARENMVICGLPLVEVILSCYCDRNNSPNVVNHAREGAILKRGDKIATITGLAVSILQAERIMLNFLQRLSGVATETHKYANILEGSKTRLLDTRKTTPGYRMLEKYAVACGGGWNHRLGLFDRVLLKDNHLAVLGATGEQRLTDAVALALSQYPDYAIEVEVDRLDQVKPVVEAGADVIMLDNFSTEDMRKAIWEISGYSLTEASGGITLERLDELRDIGLDFISTGALVHKSIWKDIGLDWE